MARGLPCDRPGESSFLPLRRPGAPLQLPRPLRRRRARRRRRGPLLRQLARLLRGAGGELAALALQGLRLLTRARELRF
jgi:hypothetical protein